jgi:hypothetical protein
MTTLLLSPSASSDVLRFELGDIIHELNNTLAPILMNVEMLRRRISDPDARRQLDLVAGNAWRGAAAVRQIAALTANHRFAVPPKTAASSSAGSPESRRVPSTNRRRSGSESSPGYKFRGKSEPKSTRPGGMRRQIDESYESGAAAES